MVDGHQNNRTMKHTTTILVIHVKGQEERKKYVESQIAKTGMPSHFIEDGNISDLTPEILDKYFIDNGQENSIKRQCPAASCMYKHILAMKYIIDNDMSGALVFEDDLALKDNFLTVFNKSMEECRQKYVEEPYIINYEESSLMFVPRSRRKKGQVLYKASRDRFTGCLYISRKAAETMMDYLDKNKTEFASDRFHNHLVEKGLINYYWSYPCIACQCSCDGRMPTMIPTKPRPYKRLKWFYKRIYKHILYFLR